VSYAKRVETVQKVTMQTKNILLKNIHTILSNN
jgi:hypothetical protein